MTNCPRCQGNGFLYDMMLNEKPCYVCEGEKVASSERLERFGYKKKEEVINDRD